MIKKYIIISFSFLSLNSYGQSFALAPGQIGSTAIHKDSSIIVGWANTCTVNRGPKRIDQPESGLASYGSNTDGVGVAEGNSLNVVSLGDGGTAILTFNPPIKNNLGPDFAVFENGFTDHYMEFAFVEVSSNGVDYFRFPAVSETPLIPQMNNASLGNCAYVHNLAGKYRQGFGTPFDLQDLDSIFNLDLNSITHVKLIDVVGSTNSMFGTTDFHGNIINDPWPTDFESSGFDLDGIGVMNQAELSLSEQQLTFQVYPNPFSHTLNINTLILTKISITNQLGEIMYDDEIIGETKINLSNLKSGYYVLRLINGENQHFTPLVKY